MYIPAIPVFGGHRVIYKLSYVQQDVQVKLKCS